MMSMELDPTKEKVYYLRELAKIIPPDGVSRRTLYKWCKEGVNDRFKVRIYMECIELTNGLGSSLEAYWRFIRAKNGDI